MTQKPAASVPTSTPLPLGPVSKGWLAEIGVQTLEQLRETGAVATYRQLKAIYPKRVSLNLLYGLHSILEGIPANQLPPEIKADLRKQAGATDK